METSAVTNEEQARYWNGDEAAHWLVHEGRYERMLAPFTRHLLTAAAIGRGTGSTIRAARRARKEGLGTVRIDHGDAQVYGFTPGAAAVATSRFGVMFFTDPAAAFANIARGLRPGGRP